MAVKIQNIVVAATPTAPLLSHLLHALSHQEDLNITVLTRETSVVLPISAGHSHDHEHSTDGANGHHHNSKISHVKTSFSESELQSQLKDKDTIICYFTGSDIHLTSNLIDAATSIGVKNFMPSEYGLDTSNSRIRELLPPYKTRYEIQEKLKSSGLKWTAIYSGLALDDAMKTDGVFGIDCLWASVVVFPHDENKKVAVSMYKDIANVIVDVATGNRPKEGNELWMSSFQTTLNDLVAVVEKALDRDLDRYEGLLEGAKKEATERMSRGYFDGGVALMGRVAVWDDKVDAWAGWKGPKGCNEDVLEAEVGKVALMVRKGEVGGDGCGC